MVAPTVARAFSWRFVPELPLGAAPRKRCAASVSVARKLPSEPPSGSWPRRAIIPSSENLQKISKQIQHQLQLRFKPRLALAAKHPPTLPAPVGSFTEILDAQCQPFRHRRADRGRPDHAGGDAARRR